MSTRTLKPIFQRGGARRQEILRLIKKDQEDSAARQRQWDAEKR